MIAAITASVLIVAIVVSPVRFPSLLQVYTEFGGKQENNSETD